MCSKINCNICGKATWTGCGQHVEEALRGVPASQRCAGHDQAVSANRPGFLKRLFGRN